MFSLENMAFFSGLRDASSAKEASLFFTFHPHISPRADEACIDLFLQDQISFLEIEEGIIHFASRGAMNIMGLGPRIVKQLIDDWKIRYRNRPAMMQELDKIHF